MEKLEYPYIAAEYVKQRSDCEKRCGFASSIALPRDPAIPFLCKYSKEFKTDGQIKTYT